ncbi:MAG: TetR family transcriptional regulator [Bacillati bacterium ANGP1]|uniref:TetR family transcriptional regulator n=1 Tax=Candidatus Segetimicrobium genomatis TaxID=2569760 RepID=A0A537JWQ6_9BACT|nr:MAG: TetR family transcriptional regulator [Terrabacteria group bacterium ANGP1]
MKRDRCSRERILEAAGALFHLRGFQSTGLDDILETSGVCRSNFYYHFRSKEDLGLEVLRRQAGAFEAGYIRGLLENAALPARRRLELLYKNVASRHRADGYRRGCPFGNLAAELSGIHPEFRRCLSAFFARWEESVDRCLREGVARGEFRPDLDTRRTATALVGQIEGAVLLMKAHRRADPIEAGVGTLLKLMESR